MKIFAVVLCCNSQKFISKSLEALHQIDFRDHSMEILVVDNGSVDDSVKYLKSAYPGLTLLENRENLGYAEGNNVGIRYALEKKADFVWLVKPNISVDRNSLLYLINAAQKFKDGGIFGSKIYVSGAAETGPVFWYAGGQMDWANLSGINRGANQPDKSQFDHDVETDFITGESMFIRTRVFADIGLLDPKYFLSFVEDDLCQRAKGSGWKLMYIHQSLAWYFPIPTPDLSPSLDEYYFTRNRLLFGLRHAPPLTKFAVVRDAVRFYLSGRPWQRRAVLDYFTGNLGSGSYQP